LGALEVSVVVAGDPIVDGYYGGGKEIFRGKTR
jgi:hypothetical protein